MHKYTLANVNLFLNGIGLVSDNFINTHLQICIYTFSVPIYLLNVSLFPVSTQECIQVFVLFYWTYPSWLCKADQRKVFVIISALYFPRITSVPMYTRRIRRSQWWPAQESLPTTLPCVTSYTLDLNMRIHLWVTSLIVHLFWSKETPTLDIYNMFKYQAWVFLL